MVLGWFGLTAGMASPEDRPLSRGTARFVPANFSSQPILVDPALDPKDVRGGHWAPSVKVTWAQRHRERSAQRDGTQREGT